MMIKLFEILNLKYPEVTPEKCKSHLAVWNGDEDPLDSFFQGNFDEWQSWQTKQNFERDFVVSLIKYNSYWLFAGLYKSLSSHYEEEKKVYIYNLEKINETSELEGRLILKFDRLGRQSYLNAENWVENIELFELKADKIRVQEFPGYKYVILDKMTLDLIVNQEIETWKSALTNVGGIYLIVDVTNGKCYVGSASGQGGIWNRWVQYSLSGHGGNKELIDILTENGIDYSKNFQYSILEILDLDSDKILERENHWKNALRSRDFGYNSN